MKTNSTLIAIASPFIILLIIFIAFMNAGLASANKQSVDYHLGAPLEDGPGGEAVINDFQVSSPQMGPGMVISVTTTNPAANPGDIFCSLIEALDNANSDSDTSGGDCPAGSGPDTIELGMGAVYTLTAVHNTTDGANGLPSITSEIVINGDNSTIVRGAAAPEFRILHNSASGILTLNDLTVQNGSLTGEGGGGIRNQGGVLTLYSSTVRGNSVVDIHGGGIQNVDGSATLYDSIIENNMTVNAASTASGGGLANRAFSQNATMTLYNTQVLSNTAGRAGGGILNSAYQNVTATLTISNSVISGNTADEAAGGVWSTHISGASGDTERVFILHSTVGNNTTFNSSGLVGGGGIVNNYGDMLITNSSIQNNTATTGSAFGGGILNALGTMTIMQSTISGNQALSAGGPFPAGGGGLVNSDGTLTLVNSTVSGNSATGGSSGGGIFNAQFFGTAPSNVVMVNTTISDNSVDASGGGLSGFNYSGGSSISIATQNSIVAGNTAPDNTNCAVIAGGTYVSIGNNLEDKDTCNFDQTTDKVNTNPLLGSLQDNGGSTWTHALMEGSPAINAANNGACAAPPVNGVDQRGVTRPYGPVCDIGSFELEYVDIDYLVYMPVVLKP
jgi:hypothetical protein